MELDALRAALRGGLVIPAHPLALDVSGGFDERHQRALTRYYLAAGAGGLAVGVHTTQFEVREHGLLGPVLRAAREVAVERTASPDGAGARAAPGPVLVAGVCGPTEQALAEARLAAGLGYHAALLSLAALGDASVDALLEHCRRVAAAIPLFGFYLQPAVGGRDLPLPFWRGFLEIPGVVAIKVAPFDRYRTLDVVRALAESGRAGEVALYTGNDDHILLDLLATHEVATAEGRVVIRFAGGLLGHWAVWTRRAAEHLERCLSERGAGHIREETLRLAGQVTEANAALFDPANRFAGCIPAIHAVLHGQGLLGSPRLLDETAGLSPGQAGSIERIRRSYPHLTDDEFVAENLSRWLG